jgi:hypothetical protein
VGNAWSLRRRLTADHDSARRTMFYRRLRKKGTQEDQLKKAKKRVVATSVMNRGIAGLSVEDLKAKKSETTDKRKAQRDATLR